MSRFSRLETQQGQEGQAAPPREASSTAAADGTGVPDPATDPATLDRRADAALFGGDAKLAMRLYSRAIDRDSTLMSAWGGLIELMLLERRLSEAGNWLNNGLALFPESVDLLALRAVHYARRGMIRQAINNSDAVLERSDAVPRAQRARGEVLVLAEHKNAAYCFDRAIELTPPHDWREPMRVALFHEERRLWATAIKYLLRANERGESEPTIYYRIGLCRAAMGQRAQAARAYETAAQLAGPDDPLLRRLNNAPTGSLLGRVRRLFGR